MIPEASPPPLPQLDCGVAVLREWRAADLLSLVAHASHADASRGLLEHFPYPYTGADGRAWLARAVDESDRAWAIDIDGAAVGGISLHPGNDMQRPSAEVGYWLGRSYWGRGIMSQVVRGFADRVMMTSPLYRLHASVYANNPASMRVLEKAGFVREGVQKSAVAQRGELLELIVYARVRTNPVSCAG